MDPNRLTEKAQEAVRQAQTVATRHRHQQVDNEHLLLAQEPTRTGTKRVPTLSLSLSPSALWLVRSLSLSALSVSALLIRAQEGTGGPFCGLASRCRCG